MHVLLSYSFRVVFRSFYFTSMNHRNILSRVLSRRLMVPLVRFVLHLVILTNVYRKASDISGHFYFMKCYFLSAGREKIQEIVSKKKLENKNIMSNSIYPNNR